MNEVVKTISERIDELAPQLTEAQRQTIAEAMAQDLAKYIANRFETLSPVLNERQRRLLAACEAAAIGRGGMQFVSNAVGLTRQTISKGIDEIDKGLNAESTDERIRKPGGGRQDTSEKDPTLIRDLEKLVEPSTRGDPESPLRWTIKSTRRIADELKAMGHQASSWLVAKLLDRLNYSLQGNRKTMEGSSHEDRDAQFEHINAKAREFLTSEDPVISVDTKKKELIGQFKNAGRELRPKGQPEPVMVHDFPGEQGRAVPYGVFDLARNEGWVSVGIDHDTATFAVNAIRQWWHTMGRHSYPNANRLLITADGGGSNGSRVRLWKLELQQLANELQLPISVCHFPPGTSKWNKIEHRLFSQITINWRGKPLASYETIVSLIRNTTTKSGLKVRCELDSAQYPTGRKVSDDEYAAIKLHRHEFHGDWNYTISPMS